MEVKLKNYSLFDEVELEPSSLEIVQKEIGESAESRERCLQLIRKCLTERKDDLQPCLDEEFLLWFLRVSKFNYKTALERIQKYYASQEKYLNVFKHYTISITESQMHRYLTASPYRMKNNSVIVISKLALDYSRLPFESKTYLDTIVASKVLTNPVTQMCGANLIINMKGFTLRTLMAFKLRPLHLLMEMLLMVLPARVRSVHFVNTTMFFPTLFRMAQCLIPKKIQERIFVHPNTDNWKSLHSYFPSEILPEDFGGHLKQSSMIDLFENVEDLEMSFREHLKYGFKTTETLRSTWSGIVLKK